jgi:hypothetical protein
VRCDSIGFSHTGKRDLRRKDSSVFEQEETEKTENDSLRAFNSMNETAKNTKDAKECTVDFLLTGELGDLAVQIVRIF